jgi:hypothetical protein
VATKDDNKPKITLVDERNGLVLGDRFQIDPSRSLPHLAIQGAQACVVHDAMGNSDEFYCLLCEPGTYVRHGMIRELAEINPRRTRLPHAASTIRLKDGRHFFAIIFDNAQARRVTEHYGSAAIPERDLVQEILPAAIQCLLDMNQKMICHRSIRPENMLINPNGEALVDQCVVHLPGERQPDFCEPVLSSLAIPGGRGEGVPADDYFALGATALQLVSGKEPGAELSDTELQAKRIIRGSYTTLVDRRKFSSAIQALLAGTLADEAHRRWSMEDMKAWAAGHWDMPRPTTGGRRAPRPFFFMDRDYHSPELLAWAFQENPVEAAVAIQTRRVEKWMRNVLEDNQAADLVESSVGMYEETLEEATSDTHELVTRVCFALDPNGPLRYRNLVITPSGIAGAIWTAFAEKDEARLSDLEELMKATLLGHWQATGSRTVKTALPLFVTTTIKSIMVERERPGFGLERVLYEMLPQAACLEEITKSTNPVTLGDLLLAMDRLAEKDPDAGLTIGRHMAGFIMAKDKGSETTVRALSAHHPGKAEELTSIGDMLAYLQRNFLRISAPNLTRALGERLKPAASQISSRLRRMVITEKIEALSGGGDLTAFVKELDVKATLARDAAEKVEAGERLEAIDRLITIASSNGAAQNLLAKKRGYRYARLLSMSVSFLTVFYFAMFEMI